jgi:hypothetical protein
MKNKIALAISVVLALTVLLTACLTELEDAEVTVTFDVNGGSPDVSPKVLTRGAKLGTITSPTKGTDEFIGWYNGFDKFTANTVINDDITLTAKWKGADTTVSDKVTVTFEATDAVPAVTKVQVSKGKALGPIFPVDPRKQGSWFEGWKDSGGTPFTKESVVTGDITITANWKAKDQFTVTLRVTTAHQEANPGIDGTIFYVYDGDSIDEWEKQFPTEMSCAENNDENRYYTFFRWSVGGNAGGIIYNERTPITANVTLTTYYGMYFYPKTFEVDLTTMGVMTGSGNIDRKPYVGGSGSDITIPGDTRPAGLGSPVTNGDGSVTATFHQNPSFLWFQTPPELRPLLNEASVANETQFAWEIEYEFEDPARETPTNQFNFLIANIRNNDNWNATVVNDLTLTEINGIEAEGVPPATHDVAGTIINAQANKDWVVIRGGRGGEVENGPFTITFKSIKIHLLQ